MCACTGSGTREPKDPSSYASIEDIRRELEEAKGQVPFSLTRTIQWLSDAASRGGGSLAFKAYSWALGLDQPAGWKVPQETKEEEMRKLKEIEGRVDESVLRQLGAVLLLSRPCVLKLAKRCPDLENADPQDLMTRMMTLKHMFPDCDIARMVELVPSGFLIGPWTEIEKQLLESSEILRHGLKGADVDAIFEEDPTILFEDPESLRTGLRRMRELWDLDEETLKNSFPDELALAVRALSLKGPPKGC
eukprot:jgi/Picsp_1/6777/NSC_04117-R1_protein